MGGSNPYIEKVDSTSATKVFTITFKTPDETLEVKVDPAKIPYGETGLPGSVLDIALGAGIDLEHACGGVCACSTCHVIVKEGLDTCPEPTETPEMIKIVYLTIESLYSPNIISSQLDVLHEALVPWVHDRLPDVRVVQTQAMAKLVQSNPVQVHALAFSCGEVLAVVEVSIA